jgi:hypothetical protein
VFVVRGLLVHLPVATIAMRLGTALPGVALQAGVPVFSGWDATRGQSMTIVGVVLLSLVSAGGLQYLSVVAFADPASWPAVAASIIVQWVIMMVSVSILTTLYGHYVEKRPLV